MMSKRNKFQTFKSNYSATCIKNCERRWGDKSLEFISSETFETCVSVHSLDLAPTCISGWYLLHIREWNEQRVSITARKKKLLQIRRMRHCCLALFWTYCVGGCMVHSTAMLSTSFTTTEEAAQRDKNYSLMNL